jgi:hypothetical protein
MAITGAVQGVFAQFNVVLLESVASSPAKRENIMEGERERMYVGEKETNPRRSKR